MQIIFLHPNLKRARTIHLSRWGAIAIGLCVSAILVVGTAAITYFVATSKVSERLQGEMASNGAASDGAVAASSDGTAAKPNAASADGDPGAAGASQRQASYMRQNIDALADKLGRLQARLTRLDSLGDRISKMAGIETAPAAKDAKRPAAALPDPPGRGGPLLPEQGMLTIDELSAAIAEVSETMERRSEQLNLIESEFLFQKAASKLVPTNKPLSGGYMSSRFGRRIDPLTGRVARHEGLDFGAPPGTPIKAAGAGVVVFAGRNGAYGNQVDIDHGEGLTTRYAHARKLLVKAGDIVRQGQEIAEVGTTGRSTGPHLHFEVRVDGQPQDPMRYLGKPLAFKGLGRHRVASR